MLKSLFIASLMLSSLSVFSQEIDPDLSIASIEIHRVANPDIKTVVEMPKIPTNPVDEVAMYVDGLIALGKKIWPIIEAGRPVITTSGIAQSLSILPQIEGSNGKAELHSMANWSAPKAVSYRVKYKNYLGRIVVEFTYTVFFQYNGSYKGNGKYITSLKVQASDIYASWGFDFDVTSELISVANVGTDTDPVASAIIQIGYKTRGIFNETQSVHTFYADGNGTLKPLNN